jgi:hypothetical protein
VGGFESGGESNMSTLECRVVSNPPHSQGVSRKFKFKLTVSFFFQKKLHVSSVISNSTN